MRGLLTPSRVLQILGSVTVLVFIWKTGLVDQFLDLHETSLNSAKAIQVRNAGNSSQPDLIVFYAYMRGGSSFFGNLMTPNKDVFYWYEPEWDIYNRLLASPVYSYPLHVLLNSTFNYRRPIAFERKYLRDQLRAMLTCQVDDLTAEQLTSWTYSTSGPGMRPYWKCAYDLSLRNSAVDCQQHLQDKCTYFVSESLQNGCHKYMMAAHGEGPVEAVPEGFPPVGQYTECIKQIKKKLSGCLPLFKESCTNRTIKAIKLLRADLDFVEDLMQDWPNIKIVYQTRDPRGILASRRKGHRQFVPSVVDEAPFLCQKMQRDMDTFQKLQTKYPGKFLITTYEDLALDPKGMTENIYKFLGIPLHKEVLQWMYSITHSKENGPEFDTMRVNAKATALAWKKYLDDSERKAIDSVCANAYDKMGYEL